MHTCACQASLGQPDQSPSEVKTDSVSNLLSNPSVSHLLEAVSKPLGPVRALTLLSHPLSGLFAERIVTARAARDRHAAKTLLILWSATFFPLLWLYPCLSSTGGTQLLSEQ